MNQSRKIWHDDARQPPPCEKCNGTGRTPGNELLACAHCINGSEWLWVRDNKDCIHLILDAEKAGVDISEISMDHDLGATRADPFARGASPDGCGCDLVRALVALRLVPPKVEIHSWAGTERLQMAAILSTYSPDTEVTLVPWRGPDMSDEEYEMAVRIVNA